ncbi:hypothetical protein K7X08_017279 [Anisodus acutangulus]|uniref:VQ domain-containing protein n=2 Tax=Anisodus TaxID=243963 RepID=A0A9Q1R9F6_9SOLA|nr:hypothetical protein K7X08_017279 [Anisodus acutangulus]KAK4348060.1 hypothetical protein RND71_034399 [Anisodus tanguticus]
MNNNTIPISPTQWMDNIQMPYNYHQTEFGLANTPYEGLSHYDSTTMTTTSPPNYTTYPSHVTSSDYQYSNLSPENSSGNGDHRSPKTSNASKPVRRRSRASKKTPTTLVNASISNFRAVVQQYTGCHTSPIKNQKGPINLNFGPQTDDGNELLESSSMGEGSQYGYYYNSQGVQEMNGSSAGYSNTGTSMDYGYQ